jgi:putative transposase
MPRTARVDTGGEIYHVINRANGRLQIFTKKEDYELFENILRDAKELVDMRIIAYTVMPNHFHLILHPKSDGDLGTFMHRVCNTHTRKYHALTKTNGTGHLYQGRYKSFLVDSNEYLLSLIKYVERNPVRASLTHLCEDWQWGSAYKRLCGTPKEKELIDEIPVEVSRNYSLWINLTEDEKVLHSIRQSIKKGVPYGRTEWVDVMIKRHNLWQTIRNFGRPKKIQL